MARSFACSSLALCLVLGILNMNAFSQSSAAPQTYTWQQLRDRFEASNPTMRAGEIGVEESRAQEITAFLRPNPDFTLSTDGTQLLPYNGSWPVFSGTQFSTSLSYL